MAAISIALVALSLLLNLLHGFALSHLLGVSPQDERYYMDGAVIWCKDGSKSFARNRFNDGYCDCPDGTDEPGTSACPESKFYCRNAGDTPRFLFSSRVNDRICDCCDGTDEYESGVICANTCTKDENSVDRIDEQGSTRTKTNDFDAQARMSRLDLENFIQNLKGIRVAIIVELVAAISLMTVLLFYRRSRARRRRFLRRNFSRYSFYRVAIEFESHRRGNDDEHEMMYQRTQYVESCCKLRNHGNSHFST